MRTPTRPDILLIVLDTLRADRLSCYGYPREITPHIDAFAESGVLFERAISPAQWTIPAHASLFTGEYPTTHMTTQTYTKHSKDQDTLAETLHRAGYHTVSFCNNPLLGTVENDLDRGFEECYNYCSKLPQRPAVASTRPRVLGQVVQAASRLVRRLTFPVQELFVNSKPLMRLAWHPWIRALWKNRLNFKGNTAQSLRDLVGYLRTRQRKGAERPLFVFINLMETHLPYRPASRFIREFAPYYRKNRQAREFIRSYNGAQQRWMLPLIEPLTELEDRSLNDMYDAEVAYEDHLLRRLFAHLDQPSVRDNTLVIVTSDHGEGLNNHGFVGHTLVAYDDLVHVPLILRYPERYPQGERFAATVSTRRIYHSVLEAANVHPPVNEAGTPLDVKGRSLARALDSANSEADTVLTEAYPSETVLTMMKNEDPALMGPFRYRHMRRAVYHGDHKLITVGGEADELFNLSNDPGELDNLIDEQPQIAAELKGLLADAVTRAERRRSLNQKPEEQPRLEVGGEVVERLRALGYVE